MEIRTANCVPQSPLSSARSFARAAFRVAAEPSSLAAAKTSQSLRRVPLPAAVLPFLPRKIEGLLFPGDPRAASKRLNRFLNGVRIEDRRKVVHSLRHRAQDRLRAAGCPEDLRWAILGHEQKTVAAGYGEGFPVPLLRRWIDKIGF